MKNIKNEVYNALANIMFETGASKEDMNEAIKWFNEKFYDEDNEESAEMNSEEEQIHEADANVFTEDADENLVERKQMKANELVVGKKIIGVDGQAATVASYELKTSQDVVQLKATQSFAMILVVPSNVKLKLLSTGLLKLRKGGCHYGRSLYNI